MFILTQFIGLYVVDHYSGTKVVDGQITDVNNPDLPFGLKSPEIKQQTDYRDFFYGIVFAFVIAISILFLLTKFNAEFILKLWFFVVVIIALGISLVAILPPIQYASIMAIIIALPLAFVKIYKREFLIHNLTELFIYPGIAAVFVPILNIYTIVILLILISAYDMWAVWHSGIMQKMAKYQINKLNIFGGFFIPYADKKTKEKIKILKQKNKDKKKLEAEFKKKKFKINVAILGGGDVIFPIIASGVVMKTLGFLPAIFVIFGATLGVGYLFLFSQKKKFYPAMPFISAGIFIAMILSYLIF
jgi:presenilin-like A22 family membrane protease